MATLCSDAIKDTFAKTRYSCVRMHNLRTQTRDSVESFYCIRTYAYYLRCSSWNIMVKLIQNVKWTWNVSYIWLAKGTNSCMRNYAQKQIYIKSCAFSNNRNGMRHTPIPWLTKIKYHPRVFGRTVNCKLRALRITIWVFPIICVFQKV